MQKYCKHILTLLVYFLISILFTWPLILNLRTTLFGDYGDTRGTIWTSWLKINKGLFQDGGPLIAYPFQSQYHPSINHPIGELIFNFPARFAGEIPWYNVVIILSFALTAFSTYILIYYLVRSRSAAFVGGLIFGFCPGAVMQAIGGHLHFCFNVFIPLFLLSLFCNREKRSKISSLFVGFNFALLVSTSLYFGYFAIYIAIAFFAFDCLTNTEKRFGGILFSYGLAAAFAFVMIIPFQYEIIMHVLSASKVQLAKAGHIRGYEELVIYSSRPLEYAFPSIDHPVLGRFIIDTVRNNLHGSNLCEQTIYLGFVPVLLCVSGFFIRCKDQSSIRMRYHFLFFVATAVFMIFLSFPPVVHWGRFKIPVISHFMHTIVPMFRVYARFGILANFFAACAAALVLAHLARRMSGVWRIIFLILVIGVLAFEYWSIPPYHARDISKPPAVYEWLAHEPADTVIAEYPMTESSSVSFYNYLFWQRIHKKRMVNGAGPDNAEAWNYFIKVNNLSGTETLKYLREIGVRYIIVHGDTYREGEIPMPLKRYMSPQASAVQYNGGRVPVNPLLKEPFKVFDNDIVYKIDQ